MTLFQLSEQAQAIEDLLYETGGELTPELEQAMTETRESMIAKVDSYNALIRKFCATSEACAAEIKRIQAIKKTADNSVERIKARILGIMELFGIERLEGETCKMMPRASKKMETEDAVLLDPYEKNLKAFSASLPVWLKIEAKIDKPALKAIEKSGGALPVGASLIQNKTLKIK